MNDGLYCIQELWSDGRVYQETWRDDEKEALDLAHEIRTSPIFEADSVRVITRDGELVQS